MGKNIDQLPVATNPEVTGSVKLPVWISGVTKSLTPEQINLLLAANPEIQFKEAGSNRGTPGQFDTINFTSGATLTPAGSTLNVAIAGGGGGGGASVISADTIINIPLTTQLSRTRSLLSTRMYSQMPLPLIFRLPLVMF